jgi:hypothetical protein
MTDFRTQQTERGNEALHSFASFLESVFGNFHISVHEHGYGVGLNGCPDIVFREYGIEVKRMEFLTKQRYSPTEDYHVSLNWLKVNGFEWRLQKKFCRENKKCHVLVVVFTWGKADPIFVGFTEAQIDQIYAECKHRPSFEREETSTEYRKAFWFGASTFELLKRGKVLNNSDALSQFFDAIPEDDAEIRV